MKRMWLLFGLAFVFAAPLHSMAQVDIKELGSAIGEFANVTDKLIQNRRERKKWEEDFKREVEKEKREAEAAERARENTKSKPYSNPTASKKVLFENSNIVGSGPTIRSEYQDTPIIKSSMTSLLVLYTKNDKEIMIWMPNNWTISYKSYDDKERTLVCNKVVGWIKYYGEDVWYKYEDAFSKILYPSYYYLVDYSEFFPNNYELMKRDDIETMTIQFEDWNIY